MSNPVVEAFFFGKALAEVLTEKVEDTLTSALSDLGKFDAETRERLRQFAEEVKLRAEIDKQKSNNTSNTITVEVDSSVDLQELLDELRAEIARLKAELNQYRQKGDN
jgi:curli biogenesis system outer membrane secretion channel CsgG